MNTTRKDEKVFQVEFLTGVVCVLMLVAIAVANFAYSTAGNAESMAFVVLALAGVLCVFCLGAYKVHFCLWSIDASRRMLLAVADGSVITVVVSARVVVDKKRLRNYLSMFRGRDWLSAREFAVSRLLDNFLQAHAVAMRNECRPDRIKNLVRAELPVWLRRNLSPKGFRTVELTCEVSHGLSLGA